MRVPIDPTLTVYPWTYRVDADDKISPFTGVHSGYEMIRIPYINRLVINIWCEITPLHTTALGCWIHKCDAVMSERLGDR